MDKYLEVLNNMKNYEWNSNYLPQLEKIELYIKGEITSQELTKGADALTRGIIYHTINKILNYQEKDVRYLIELPQDMYFATNEAPCIRAGRIINFGVVDDDMETIGPDYFSRKSSTFYADNTHIEITGDFSKYPKGAMLFYSDWYNIISKYPNLYKRMYRLIKGDYEMRNKAKEITQDKVKEYVDKQISRWVNLPRDSEPTNYWNGKEEAEYLPQEVIDSIEFVMPIEYLTREQILSSNFGTFEEVAKGIKPQEESIAEQPPVIQKDQSEIHSESEDGIVNVELKDIIKYLEGPSHKKMTQALDFDMEYMTELSTNGSTKKELTTLLADFVINYKGDNASSHLLWLCNDNDVTNGKICNIPIIEFAKLNSPEMVDQLHQFGAEDVKDAQLENKDNVIEIAKLFGYDKKREASLSDVVSTINDMLKPNVGEAYQPSEGVKKH